jgi:hypothetical protein
VFQTIDSHLSGSSSPLIHITSGNWWNAKWNQQMTACPTKEKGLEATIPKEQPLKTSSVLWNVQGTVH